MIVGKIAIINNDKTAMNLAVTISKIEIGLVIKVSIVPVLYSSENTLMLTDGMNSKKISGAIEKKESMLA